MYHSIKQQAYNRREYMGGVPASRITQFVSGNKKGFFPIQLWLLANESCQIRHTALESARITANRALEKNAGMSDYRLKIRVYPHHV
jgi:large subunit ribosomal protein L10e